MIVVYHPGGGLRREHQLGAVAERPQVVRDRQLPSSALRRGNVHVVASSSTTRSQDTHYRARARRAHGAVR